MTPLRLLCCLLLLPATTFAQRSLTVDTPVAPPAWALLQHQVLAANADACEEFYEQYFDSRGYLECVERWGGDDGPDDAIECCADWTLLYVLGADQRVLDRYLQAWEGHIQQYTQARTVDVPMARDGMYFKEFPTMFDWVHLGEGSIPFSMQGLCTPDDIAWQKRARRFAGFYLPDGTPEPNYDPEHKIIRSMFNGSRGPLLRKATGLDWAGDPIEVAGRFDLRHGEETYEQMVEHFEDYNDVVGDHPQNMCATSLAVNAFAITNEDKYRDWILEYVDAWVERTHNNNGIIPTNIGLDGVPGSAADGKWYGGVYGWGFSVKVPQSGEMANRNTHQLGIAGFGNAYLMTGDRRYVDTWRTMIESVNRQAKTIDGQTMYPSMYGDDGWYAWRPHPYSAGSLDVWYWSMDPADKSRLAGNGWLTFLEGKDPEYPQRLLQGELSAIRTRVAGMRADETTADTRLSDDPLRFNPAAARGLVQLMLGGMYPGRFGGPLHARLRYFDPVTRRPGIPSDVASLVTGMTADTTEVALVNTNQLQARDLVVRMGAYGEHRCESVRIGDQEVDIRGNDFTIRLEPGCGAQLTLKISRYVNPPTLTLPWNRPL